jgi:hypothetical protein
MMVLGHVMDYNNDHDNDSEDDEEENASDPDLLSVHASFILVNFKGLTAKDVQLDLGQQQQQQQQQGNSSYKTSVLLQAFEDFLITLLATTCPREDDHDTPDCWEQDPEATYDPLTGRLCGSHAEYVRQIYCHEYLQQDPPFRGRELEPQNVIENIIIYRAQDSHCPIPMMAQGKGKLLS